MAPLLNNLIGLSLTLVYICIYHTIRKDTFTFLSAYSISCSAVSIFLFKMIPSDFLGLLSVVLSTLQYMAPIEQIKPALTNKDHKYIDAYIIPALVCNAFVWGIYGILVDDWFIVIPNILGLGFSLFQLSILAWTKGYLPHESFQWLASKVGDNKDADDDIVIEL